MNKDFPFNCHNCVSNSGTYHSKQIIQNVNYSKSLLPFCPKQVEYYSAYIHNNHHFIIVKIEDLSTPGQNVCENRPVKMPSLTQGGALLYLKL